MELLRELQAHLPRDSVSHVNSANSANNGNSNVASAASASLKIRVLEAHALMLTRNKSSIEKVCFLFYYLIFYFIFFTSFYVF